MIEHHSLADQIHREIKRRILANELTYGERLHVEQIARELDVSNSPVKAALKQLESEGLVEIRPRSSTVVRSFSTRDVVEIYAARAVIEPTAAATVVRENRVTADLIAALDANLEEMRGATAGREFVRPMTVTDTDSAFHRLIVGATDNRVIARMHEMLIDQAQLVRNFASRGPRAKETISEHRRIIDALRACDEQEAIDASVAHLRAAERVILKTMEEDPNFSEAPQPPQQVANQGGTR